MVAYEPLLGFSYDDNCIIWLVQLSNHKIAYCIWPKGVPFKVHYDKWFYGLAVTDSAINQQIILTFAVTLAHGLFLQTEINCDAEVDEF